jgi:hypothetical protein
MDGFCTYAGGFAGYTSGGFVLDRVDAELAGYARRRMVLYWICQAGITQKSDSSASRGAADTGQVPV